MAYWVLALIGPEDGEGEFRASFFENVEDAKLAYELALRYDDPGARLVEANVCLTDGCSLYPQWGMEYCEICLD